MRCYYKLHVRKHSRKVAYYIFVIADANVNLSHQLKVRQPHAMGWKNSDIHVGNFSFLLIQDFKIVSLPATTTE